MVNSKIFKTFTRRPQVYEQFLPLQTKQSKDPVLLWLQGGPGTSSLFGLFVEHGPFGVNKDLTRIIRCLLLSFLFI